MTNELSTEEKILKAAEEVFMRDGYDGSRMQDIADVAGINKALLHYYFRSKDKLFEKIFDAKAQIFFPRIEQALYQDLSFIEKVEVFIEQYINLLRSNPYLPLFVLNTINKKNNADFIKKMPVELSQRLIMSYLYDLQQGKVREVNPLQFVISLMGMCVFPFLGRPILQNMFKADSEAFDKLMEQRIQELKQYARLILKP